MTDAPLKVVTTLDPRSGYYHALRREFQRLHVDDAWVNIGPLAHADVPSLIQACDVVCLFSVLESFSSNFTEAWAMKKPLLVSDADWARSACGKAAMYVSPTDVSRLADALIRLTRPAVQAELLKQYGRHFRAYPTAEGRCRQYLECMETARRLGCISTAESKSLRQFRCGRAA
jgi:glycosyltransferase involved in cell wall biosynthesis